MHTISTSGSVRALETRAQIRRQLTQQPADPSDGDSARAGPTSTNDAFPLSPCERRLVQTFGHVTPDLLAKRDLLQRTDTKFVMPRRLLPELLAAVRGEYRILFSGDNPSAFYLTEYFDSPDRELFHAHRRGKRLRFKIRVRHYPDRLSSYLEVKGKIAGGGTTKWRRPLPYLCEVLSAQDSAFIAEKARMDPSRLMPVLVNEFRRITLVGIDRPERITFDMELRFQDDDSQQRLERVLITEVKQARLDHRSPILRVLTARGLRPASASKYCLGSLLLQPALRHNRLRPALLGLERASQC